MEKLFIIAYTRKTIEKQLFINIKNIYFFPFPPVSLNTLKVDTAAFDFIVGNSIYHMNTFWDT